MIRIARPIAAGVLFVLMLSADCGRTAAAGPQHRQHHGQLYRAQNDNHYTVFLVTSEGVIMSDPINRDFSRWLKNEIATRFRVPVRYVVYTHRDWDHASGGVVFADTAQFVGHINMLAGLAPPKAIRPCRQRTPRSMPTVTGH
jgi:glyoxylase-like metal-dependent hydrolase (beta-lactamase superfamily II)